MRPAGVASKNERGARMTAASMRVCSEDAAEISVSLPLARPGVSPASRSQQRSPEPPKHFDGTRTMLQIHVELFRSRRGEGAHMQNMSRRRKRSDAPTLEAAYTPR
jgi:hypothetical protein